eukprot:12255477-Alexandrium_andersonii.AAC.1
MPCCSGSRHVVTGSERSAGKAVGAVGVESGTAGSSIDFGALKVWLWMQCHASVCFHLSREEEGLSGQP